MEQPITRVYDDGQEPTTAKRREPLPQDPQATPRAMAQVLATWLYWLLVRAFFFLCAWALLGRWLPAVGLALILGWFADDLETIINIKTKSNGKDSK